MKFLDKFKKEPRLIIAAVNFLFLFLPWISVSIEGMDLLDIQGVNFAAYISGFAWLFKLSNTLLGILVFLLIAFLIVIPFVPVLEKFNKLLFLIVPLLAIIFSFIATTGLPSSNNIFFESKANHGLGFWLSILAFLAIIVFTFIIDFKVSGQSIKQKGFKGVVSDIAGQFSSSASEIAAGLTQPKTEQVLCPSCNNGVPKGTKFCPQCGTQLPEAKKCAGCGAELPTGTAFCSICGTKAE
jgi:hypothetical protein